MSHNANLLVATTNVSFYRFHVSQLACRTIFCVQAETPKLYSHEISIKLNTQNIVMPVVMIPVLPEETMMKTPQISLPPTLGTMMSMSVMLVMGGMMQCEVFVLGFCFFCVLLFLWGHLSSPLQKMYWNGMIEMKQLSFVVYFQLFFLWDALSSDSTLFQVGPAPTESR